MKTGKSLVLAAVLAALGGSALAQSPPPAAPAAPPPPAAPEVEQQLEAARQRLQAAAREVAELSSQVGDDVGRRMIFVNAAGAGAPPRAMLGVQLGGKAEGGGANVAEVSPGGAAAEAGVQAGDVIVLIDGKDLAKQDDPARVVVERMREVEPGSKVKLRVLRAGKARDLEVTARRPPVMNFRMARPGVEGSPEVRIERRILRRDMDGREIEIEMDGPPPPMGPMHEMMQGMGGRGLGGLELATLTPRLGSYFGAKGGVLVVRAGSPALKLEDGDVIQSVDGREPASAAHATRILRSYRPGEKLSVKVLRDRKSQTLEVTLPAREPGERRPPGAGPGPRGRDGHDGH
jgi:predicted metalloprotease with PDZ domain